LRKAAKFADPVLPAAKSVGAHAHVVAVDEHVGVHVDEPGQYQAPFDAESTARLLARQRRADGDDLAAGDADIHHAAQARAGIEHFAAGQQQVVAHCSSFAFAIRPRGRCP
jgi:hypothetical protein